MTEAAPLMCPCCGQVRETLNLDAIIVACRFSPMERIAFDLLVSAKGQWIPTARLIDLTYASRLDGGPITDRHTISNRIAKIRERLRNKQIPCRIESAHSSGYRLVWGKPVPLPIHPQPGRINGVPGRVFNA